MKWQLFVFVLVILLGCRESDFKFKADRSVAVKNVALELKPFELIVYDSDYSAAYALQYILTDKDLKITFKSDIIGGKDTTIFKTDLQPSSTLIRLSNINLDSLQKSYTNFCIDDGSQIFVILTKDNKTKTVQLSNYYQPNIGLAIELINGLVPKKYEIWYDKEELIRKQAYCAKIMIYRLINPFWPDSPWDADKLGL